VIQPRVLQVQIREAAPPRIRVAAGGDDLHRGRAGERAADAGAEIAETADHDDAHGMFQSRAGRDSN